MGRMVANHLIWAGISEGICHFDILWIQLHKNSMQPSEWVRDGKRELCYRKGFRQIKGTEGEPCMV